MATYLYRNMPLGFALGMVPLSLDADEAAAQLAAANQKVAELQKRIGSSPCADCSLNNVTGFSGPDGTSTRRQYGNGQQHTNNDSDQSWFVPRGFEVELVEDANWNQRYSRGRRVTKVYSTNAHQVVNRPHHVFWLTITDRRSDDERARDAQVGTLMRELSVAEQEAGIARSAADAAARTAAALAESKESSAAREQVRGELQAQQAAAQASAAAQSAYAAEQAQQQARLQAEQQAREFAAASGAGGVGDWLPWVAGGGVLLVVVAFAMRGRGAGVT